MRTRFVARRRARAAGVAPVATGRARDDRPLGAAGLRLAVTSNADGNVAEMLARHELLQVGEGPGVGVEHVTDSGTVDVHKPDPAGFQATADGFDVDGAAGAPIATSEDAAIGAPGHGR